MTYVAIFAIISVLYIITVFIAFILFSILKGVFEKEYISIDDSINDLLVLSSMWFLTIPMMLIIVIFNKVMLLNEKFKIKDGFVSNFIKIHIFLVNLGKKLNKGN